MEEIKITWQLLSIVGIFCGSIIGLVKYLANEIKEEVKKLVDKTNGHTVEIAVHDERLDGHDNEINNLKERVFQVTYRKTP